MAKLQNVVISSLGTNMRSGVHCTCYRGLGATDKVEIDVSCLWPVLMWSNENTPSPSQQGMTRGHILHRVEVE